MKIYVITMGSYSDYHICAVADNMKRAKQLKKLFEGDYYTANIETYDTETYTDMFERGYKEYNCRMERNGDISIRENSEHTYPEWNVSRWNDNTYRCDVIAKDEEHARKIFTDKVAEYKARYHLI